MPLKRIKSSVMERIRLQRLKREHKAYLEHSPPRQFKSVIANYDEELAKRIEDLARRTQPRTVKSVIGFKYLEGERRELEKMKTILENVYECMSEERRRALIAAAHHMDKHGPPYEDLAKHVIETARRHGHI